MASANELGDVSAGLQGFGLTEYESRVYVALLSNGPSTVNQLQYTSMVPRTKVYQVALQLVKKEVAKELEGKPVRFEACAPDVFQEVLVDRERSVRSLKRAMASLKKLRERNIMPQDSVEERYLSLGSQSTLIKLKEAILRAQSTIRCSVDSWGLHLVQECSDELEAVCRQDVDVRIVASVPPVLPTFPFASSKLRIRYGKHMSGRSAFMIDSGEVLLVNSQTGRGFQFMLGELRGALSEDLFEEFWKGSTGSKTLASVSNSDSLPFLIDGQTVGRIFVDAVTKVVKDESQMQEIGERFLEILEERATPKLRNESFDNSVKLILALMQEELGEEATAEYDTLTRIFRLELPSYEEGTPASIWYFALAGLLKASGVRNELLNDAPFPEARNRIIQRKFAATS
ncbi:MAG: helix-turn-helix domain-containing protein [Nitrososphaerales archaeon]|jgi:sugar-specific transcriptional regulator TrmB